MCWWSGGLGASRHEYAPLADAPETLQARKGVRPVRRSRVTGVTGKGEGISIGRQRTCHLSLAVQVVQTMPRVAAWALPSASLAVSGLCL